MNPICSALFWSMLCVLNCMLPVFVFLILENITWTGAEAFFSVEKFPLAMTIQKPYNSLIYAYSIQKSIWLLIWRVHCAVQMEINVKKQQDGKKFVLPFPGINRFYY